MWYPFKQRLLANLLAKKKRDAENVRRDAAGRIDADDVVDAAAQIIGGLADNDPPWKNDPHWRQPVDNPVHHSPPIPAHSVPYHDPAPTHHNHSPSHHDSGSSSSYDSGSFSSYDSGSSSFDSGGGGASTC